MSDKKLLENEDILKVTGGVGQGGKHSYSVEKYLNKYNHQPNLSY